MDGRRERSGRDDDDNSDRGSGAHIHAVPGLPQLPWNQDAVTQGLSLASACVVRAWVTKFKGSSILHHLRFGPVGMNKMFNSEVKKELHGRTRDFASGARHPAFWGRNVPLPAWDGEGLVDESREKQFFCGVGPWQSEKKVANGN